MKRGDTIKSSFGSLLVATVNGDYVKGRWVSGILKGKEACCSRAALQGKDPGAPPPPSRRTTKRARAELQEALLTDMKVGPVDITPWAHERGVEEALVRTAIGSLRRMGFPVVAQGKGKFGL